MGNIILDSESVVAERGFVYSSSNIDPEIDGANAIKEIVSGTGTGDFLKDITGLTESTTYYYKSYATKNNVTVYGDVLNFSTISTATTNIPDSNFEQALIDKGYDFGEIDRVVYIDNITGITYLDISKNPNTPDSDKIRNLSGIEDFTALTVLSCYGNSLSTLDVSENTALTILSCRNNSLTTLDVSANTALTLLYCNNNQLTNLNVKNGNNHNFIYKAKF